MVVIACHVVYAVDILANAPTELNIMQKTLHVNINLYSFTQMNIKHP